MSEDKDSQSLASLPFTRSDIHILAIDDDAMQLKVVTKALQDLGYKVKNAENGQEALKILNSGEQIDFILSDVMMPVMNGPQFLATCRADPRFIEIPIVMMSSNDQYEIVFDCLSKGADDYMIKPLSPQVLKNIYANVWLKRKQNAAAAKIQHQIVESSVISQRIEQMKKSFAESVQTPLKDIIVQLEALMMSGGVKPEATQKFSQSIQKLKGLNEEEIATGPKTQIPAKMQDFFASQFGVGDKPQKVITPVAVPALRKRQAPAPVVPHLQPLNLGEQLVSLDFNVWNINENVLMNLANDLFENIKLPQNFGAKPGEVEHFLKRAQQSHKPNPFHNFRRACDCLQLVVHALNRCNKPFSTFEKIGSLFAALLHDIDHPGTNNMFQIRTSSQTALLYNDRKVLENNSASVGARLIQDCFAFSIDDEQFAVARSTFLNCVLHTDYSKLQKFLGKIITHDLDWNNKDHRAHALALLVLMGDLSFAIRPWDVASYWYGMMRDEQLQQGDMERRLGMPVAPLMDRRQDRPQATLVKTHFKVLVMPVFQAGCRVFPELEEEFMTALQRNLQIIEEMETVAQQQSA